MILEFVRVRKEAIPPVRANPSDAGLDLFFNPENREPVLIKPGESKLFQTGYKFGVPHGYCLEVKNRSGNAAKKSLLVGACIIDPGYDGEVFVNLHNVGKEDREISPGDKIAQVVMYPVVHFKAFEKGDEDLYDYYPIAMSDRGDGALGSTDKAPKDLRANLPQYADLSFDFKGEWEE
jgi:dUTP pyrophosphatase